MREPDERVLNYAVILTDTWDRREKGSKDKAVRPCTETCMILETNGGTRGQVLFDVAYCIEQQAKQQRSLPFVAYQSDSWVLPQAIK